MLQGLPLGNVSWQSGQGVRAFHHKHSGHAAYVLKVTCFNFQPKILYVWIAVSQVAKKLFRGDENLPCGRGRVRLMQRLNQFSGKQGLLLKLVTRAVDNLELRYFQSPVMANSDSLGHRTTSGHLVFHLLGLDLDKIG